MPISVRAPRSEAEWDAYYRLRWRVLRQPWQQPPGSERDPLDANGVHRMVCDGERVLAVGRLHRVDDDRVQIRYVAVDERCRGQGHGTRVMEALEQVARDMGARSVMLQSREGAVPFYRACGYRVVEKSYLLFNEIQHYRMHKSLAG